MEQIAVALNELSVAFAHLSEALRVDAKTVKAEPKNAPESESRFVKSDKPAPPFEEVVKTAEDISVPMKKEIVREILSTLSKNGHTGDVKTLLNKYGTGKLSSVDPKNYVALVKEAQAISDNAA